MLPVGYIFQASRQAGLWGAAAIDTAAADQALAAALDRAVVHFSLAGIEAVVLEKGTMYEFSLAAMPQLHKAYALFANKTSEWPEARYTRKYDPSCDKHWTAAQ